MDTEGPRTVEILPVLRSVLEAAVLSSERLSVVASLVLGEAVLIVTPPYSLLRTVSH
jgi:hypothetical protein